MASAEWKNELYFADNLEILREYVDLDTDTDFFGCSNLG